MAVNAKNAVTDLRKTQKYIFINLKLLKFSTKIMILFCISLFFC